MSEQRTHTIPLEDKLTRIASSILLTIVWTSALIFGLYILVFYAAPLFGGNLEQWNELLPNIYKPENPSATVGIGIHFAAGGLILIMGAIQLMSSVRQRFPVFHRWVGRIYIVACLLAAVGGFLFILINGTVGGWIMDIAFGLYGILMFIAAVETMRHAMARRMDKHRAWAIRLFALAIGSWLYRMDYGLWMAFTDRLGMDRFTGPFDYFMDFWFYIPNLIVAEIFIGQHPLLKKRAVKIIGTLLMLLASLLLGIGTYYFTRHFWGPEILEFFRG